MIVSRKISKWEIDLLIGNEFKDLVIYDLGGELLFNQCPPCDGWNNDILEAYPIDDLVNEGWEAYLGLDKSVWIGSSEV